MYCPMLIEKIMNGAMANNKTGIAKFTFYTGEAEQ